MEMKLVAPQMFAHNQQQINGKANNQTLKGINFPETESLEHSLFNRKSNNLISKDMYEVCLTVSENIKSIPYITASTGGPG